MNVYRFVRLTMKSHFDANWIQQALRYEKNSRMRFACYEKKSLVDKIKKIYIWMLRGLI